MILAGENTWASKFFFIQIKTCFICSEIITHQKKDDDFILVSLFRKVIFWFNQKLNFIDFTSL